VTNAAIAPLLLAALPVRTPSAGPAHPPQAAAVPRRGLSLPEPPITRTADTVYGMSALDRGRRIADRAVIDALGWTPGTRLHLDAARTHLTLRAAIDGALAVTDHRYLWLPAATRQRLGLQPGDRVLLAAQPGRQTLVVYPPAALDELLAHARPASPGGDRNE
jgi:bifunctional DNA-binding transcriptional regulator/antitoxin component of YhaV-PrlF toxin-antitoxin module